MRGYSLTHCKSDENLFGPWHFLIATLKHRDQTNILCTNKNDFSQCLAHNIWLAGRQAKREMMCTCGKAEIYDFCLLCECVCAFSKVIIMVNFNYIMSSLCLFFTTFHFVCVCMCTAYVSNLVLVYAFEERASRRSTRRISSAHNNGIW